MTTIDHRGRDLVIISGEEQLQLPTPELLRTLFGAHLPANIRAAMGRDKRHHFLRTQPINFPAVKKALQAQKTPFTVAIRDRVECRAASISKRSAYELAGRRQRGCSRLANRRGENAGRGHGYT